MARFGQVAGLAEEMAGTASRLQKRAAIADAIGEVEAECSNDVGLFCLYLAGLPFPEADPRKLNVGGALLTKALLAVSGANDAELGVAFRRYGDMGSAAFDLLVARSDPAKTSLARVGTEIDAAPGMGGELTLAEVAETFAGMAGAKTTAIRAALLEALLRRARPLEAKYLIKLMLGDMRIGVKQSLVEEAIAVAASADVARGSACRDAGGGPWSGCRARVCGDAGSGAHECGCFIRSDSCWRARWRRQRRRWSGLQRSPVKVVAGKEAEAAARRWIPRWRRFSQLMLRRRCLRM